MGFDDHFFENLKDPGSKLVGIIALEFCKSIPSPRFRFAPTAPLTEGNVLNREGTRNATRKWEKGVEMGAPCRQFQALANNNYLNLKLERFLFTKSVDQKVRFGQLSCLCPWERKEALMDRQPVSDLRSMGKSLWTVQGLVNWTHTPPRTPNRG